MAYDIYPGVDEGYNFPPQVRQSIASSVEIKASIENETSEVIPGLVSEALSKDPTIRDAAADAVEPVLLTTNVVRAYPEGPVEETGRGSIPMYWTYKSLNDPYENTYSDEYKGTWVGSTPYRGDVPILNDKGKIWTSQIPDAFVTRDELPSLIPSEKDITNAIANVRNRTERVPSRNLPIFGARLAKARRRNEPLAIINAGSSTTATKPGYTERFNKKLQNLYPVESPSLTQWSNVSNFTKRAAPGIHCYNSAEGGTTAATYLNDRESDVIAGLEPAMIIHMIGSNDYALHMSKVDHKNHLLARLAYLDGVLTLPCQHVFVNSYARQDVTNQNPSWSVYKEAQMEIASERKDTAFFDVEDQFAANGIPGADSLTLLGTDKVHLTQDGYDFMADLLTDLFIS